MELERAKFKWCHNDKENISEFENGRIRIELEQNKTYQRGLRSRMH